MLIPSMISSSAGLRSELHQVLEDRGFVPDAAGFRRGRLRFGRSGRWCFLSLPSCGDVGPGACPGDPGLWKPGPGRDAHVFPLPVAALAANDEDEDPGDHPGEAGAGRRLESCLGWALATWCREIPEGWAVPGGEVVADWLEGARSTIRIGGIVRQVEVIREPGRLALQVPLVSRNPADLPAVRRAWLDRLLGTAQDCWCLPRVGWSSGGVAVAEVDLSGVPPGLGRSLARLGVESLGGVVASVTEVAELITGTDEAPQLLESPPHAREPEEQHEPE
jgi:hypothetical protein